MEKWGAFPAMNDGVCIEDGVVEGESAHGVLRNILDTHGLDWNITIDDDGTARADNPYNRFEGYTVTPISVLERESLNDLGDVPPGIPIYK